MASATPIQIRGRDELLFEACLGATDFQKFSRHPRTDTDPDAPINYTPVRAKPEEVTRIVKRLEEHQFVVTYSDGMASYVVSLSP